MTAQNAERLGQLADTVDNLVSALEMPLDDKLHLTGIRACLPEVVDTLKVIYISETGDNPWPKDLEEISQSQLDRLSNEYIGEDDHFANFSTFWGFFLATDPDPAEMTKLLHQMQDWGYVLDNEF